MSTSVLKGKLSNTISGNLTQHLTTQQILKTNNVI
jgi:hypothetical protein